MAANDIGRTGHGDPPPPAKKLAGERASEKMVKAVVARGRSVMVPVGKRVIGFHPVTEAEIYGPVTQYVEELQEVELPESDVVWMRKAGYLIDPNNQQAVARGEGPSFTEIRGMQPQNSAYGR